MRHSTNYVPTTMFTARSLTTSNEVQIEYIPSQQLEDRFQRQMSLASPLLEGSDSAVADLYSYNAVMHKRR